VVRRLRSILVLAGLLLPLAAAADEPRLLWLPPIERDLPAGLAAQAADALRAALVSQGGLALVSPEEVLARAEAIPAEVAADLARARRASEQGREQLLELQMDEAIEAFQTARVGYRRQGAWLDDPDPLIAVLMGLGEALASSGDQDNARAAYGEIVVLSPEYVPNPSEVPSRFRDLFEEERGRLRQVPSGGLRVAVSPPGATVVLDGLTAGKSPLERDGLLPGLHFVRIHLAGHESLREAIEVQSGEQTLVEGKLLPRAVPELLRRLLASLGSAEAPAPAERPEVLARGLGAEGGVDAVAMLQLARVDPAGEPVLSLALVRAPAREVDPVRATAVQGVRFPADRAEGVARLVARRVLGFVASGEAPPAPLADLGLDFTGHLLGVSRPGALVVAAPAGKPGPGAPPAGPLRVKVEVFPPEEPVAPVPPPPAEEPLWTRWWLWTTVGAVVAGGLALTLALTLEPEQQIIRDPDHIHIQVERNP
jgi:hypothetical protein